MTELGIGDALQWLPSTVGMFYDGKIFPLDGALDLLAPRLRLARRSPPHRPRHTVPANEKAGLGGVRARHRSGVAAQIARRRRIRPRDGRAIEGEVRPKLGPDSRWCTCGKSSSCARPAGKTRWQRSTSATRAAPFRCVIDALEAKLREIGVQMHSKADVQSVTPNGDGGVTIRVDGEDAARSTPRSITTPSASLQEARGWRTGGLRAETGCCRLSGRLLHDSRNRP